MVVKVVAFLVRYELLVTINYSSSIGVRQLLLSLNHETRMEITHVQGPYLPKEVVLLDSICAAEQRVRARIAKRATAIRSSNKRILQGLRI